MLDKFGFDFPNSISSVPTPSFRCLKDIMNYTFTTLDIGNMTALNYYISQNYKNAHDVGFPQIDLNLVISAVEEPKPLIDEVISELFNTTPIDITHQDPILWLEVSERGEWSDNCTANTISIQKSVDASLAWRYFDIGIHTTKAEWELITCNWTGFRAKLFYEQLNGQANTDDFQDFGAWKQCPGDQKQYNADIAVCGTKINQDVIYWPY